MASFVSNFVSLVREFAANVSNRMTSFLPGAHLQLRRAPIMIRLPRRR
jgi:hypothetical protein